MLYNRNKKAFKKTTAKVQHHVATQNILSLIRKTQENNNSNIQGHPKQKAKQIEAEVQKKYEILPQTPTKLREQSARMLSFPKICESIYNTTKKNQHHLQIDNVLDMVIRNSNDNENRMKMHINELQHKVQFLEKCLKGGKQRQGRLLEQIQANKDIKNNRNIVNGACECNAQNSEQCISGTLQNKYVRYVMLSLCSELVQVKSHVQQQSKLKTINQALGKGQQMLQMYRNINNNANTNMNMSYQQLQQKCKYQQKTVQHLRSTHPAPINQIKLLRHQINRVFNHNQYLLTKINNNNDKNEDNLTNHNKEQQLQSTIQQLQQELSQVRQQNSKYLMSVSGRQNEIKNIKDEVYKLQVQKQCLMDFLEEEKNKNQSLHNSIMKYQVQILQLSDNKIQLSRLNKENQRLKRQIHALTNEIQQCKREVYEVINNHQHHNDHNDHSGNTNTLISSKLLQQEQGQPTTQQLCRILQPYPKYFRLFSIIISQYQQKISKLQQSICEEKENKEKLMEWCNASYNLIQEHIANNSSIQMHLQQLYNIDNIVYKYKIEKLLRKIRALSIGIDEREIQEMEQQLQQYILSLKSRNQVIKEVQYEDGSSVASDAFTQHQFQ